MPKAPFLTTVVTGAVKYKVAAGNVIVTGVLKVTTPLSTDVTVAVGIPCPPKTCPAKGALPVKTVTAI